MKNHDKLFADLITGTKKVETDDDIISKKIDDIESRMSDLIDKKLDSLGANSDRKGVETNGTQTHIEDGRVLVNETGTDTGDNITTGTDTDDTSNNI